MPYTLPNLSNGSGIEQLLIYESGQVSNLAPFLLLFIFIVIFGSGYFNQSRKLGKGNAPMWASISGLITTTGAYILFLYQGIISLQLLIACVVFTILFTVWFLFSPSDDAD